MQESSKTIIQKYKKISKIFFQYLIFFVAFVVGILLFQTTLSRSQSIEIFEGKDNFALQKTKLIAEFHKFMRQNINNHDMTIHILQWDLETEQWFIKSVNNLISYKWFVLPRYFYVFGTIPVKHIDYFSSEDYDINELEHFVHTFIFTKRFTITKPFTRVYLPLTENIIDTFNLWCVFENKFSSRTCNHFLNEFLDGFFVYNLSREYPHLKNIFSTIQKNTKHKEKFCEWLSKYLLYANDHNDAVQELFVACWPDYEELFKRTTFFIDIQNNLDNQVFDHITYRDTILNTYKLLSYQQQIYQDFLVNKVDVHKINNYLDFVRELLRKDNIDAFYKDLIYRYNNKYLVTTIENIMYQSTTFTQNIGSSRIASLLSIINTINEWEPMLGFAWLTKEVHNKDLLIVPSSDSISSTSSTWEERIETRLQNLSYLTIERKSISNTIIDIVGYLRFSAPDTTKNIKSHIIIDYQNDMLLVKSIELQNKAGINEVLKNLLRIQQFSIGEIYSYINKNLIFYEQENAPISASTDLCPQITTLTNINLISCTNNDIIIEKNTIRYTFTLQNWWLEHIELSDKTLENHIKTNYSNVIGNNYALFDIIKALLNYQAPQQIREWTTNAIFVFERIQKYLWIKTNDIADKDGRILVDFTLWWINFIINYDIQNNTMWPWYFKDILINNSPYPIKNFNLLLDDSNQNRINTFVIDPLSAIKNADLTAWQNYQERLKKTTNN